MVVNDKLASGGGLRPKSSKHHMGVGYGRTILFAAGIPCPVSVVGMELVTEGWEHQAHAHRKAPLVLAVRGLWFGLNQQHFWWQ